MWAGEGSDSSSTRVPTAFPPPEIMRLRRLLVEIKQAGEQWRGQVRMRAVSCRRARALALEGGTSRHHMRQAAQRCGRSLHHARKRAQPCYSTGCPTRSKVMLSVTSTRRIWPGARRSTALSGESVSGEQHEVVHVRGVPLRAPHTHA